ncbi:MAG: CHAP domain-containing protein, partial [Terracoccus sp.]
MTSRDMGMRRCRPGGTRSGSGLLVVGTVLALVAAVGPTTAAADDGVGVGGHSATSGPESPQSVQGPRPAPMVDPVQNATSSEWIVLCTSFSPCQAAGYGNDGYDAVYQSSFWSQYSGHNCTNYVAYRMIRNGMSSTRPAAIRGNALNWGVALASQTNDSPTVGSVAWWDSSFSSTGHVAYVEKVVSSSEIYVSEDNWGGDFRWRKITRSGGRWPQGFIHLKDLAAPGPSPYQAISPVRIVDTRLGLGASRRQVTGGTEIAVQVAGRAGLPSSGVQSVVLNVTAVNPQAAGYLTVRPDSGSRPSSSNLNYARGATIANQVIAKVGSDGKARVYSSADSDVVVDVAGYYLSTQNMSTLTPTRLLDTRSGIGAGAGPVAGGSRVDLSVAGRGGVPSSAAAVVLNVTAVTPSSAGYATVWPAGISQPSTSNLNYSGGDVVAGLVVAKVGIGGKVSIATSAKSHLIADVLGWVPSTSDVVAGTPARVLDTRTGTGVSRPGAMPAGGTVSLKVSGVGGVPSSGVKAVMLTLTVASPQGEGYETAYPSGTTRPETSNVNYTTGRVVANSVLAKVASDGTVRLYTSKGSHLVADVQGY